MAGVLHRQRPPAGTAVEPDLRTDVPVSFGIANPSTRWNLASRFGLNVLGMGLEPNLRRLVPLTHSGPREAVRSAVLPGDNILPAGGIAGSPGRMEVLLNRLRRSPFRYSGLFANGRTKNTPGLPANAAG